MNDDNITNKYMHRSTTAENATYMFYMFNHYATPPTSTTLGERKYNQQRTLDGKKRKRSSSNVGIQQETNLLLLPVSAKERSTCCVVLLHDSHEMMYVVYVFRIYALTHRIILCISSEDRVSRLRWFVYNGLGFVFSSFSTTRNNDIIIYIVFERDRSRIVHKYGIDTFTSE